MVMQDYEEMLRIEAIANCELWAYFSVKELKNEAAILCFTRNGFLKTML